MEIKWVHIRIVWLWWLIVALPYCCWFPLAVLWGSGFCQQANVLWRGGHKWYGRMFTCLGGISHGSSDPNPFKPCKQCNKPHCKHAVTFICFQWFMCILMIIFFLTIFIADTIVVIVIILVVLVVLIHQAFVQAILASWFVQSSRLRCLVFFVCLAGKAKILLYLELTLLLGPALPKLQWCPATWLSRKSKQNTLWDLWDCRYFVWFPQCPMSISRYQVIFHRCSQIISGRVIHENECMEHGQVSGQGRLEWESWGVALLAEEMANQKRYVVDYKDNPTARKARSDFIYGRLDADTATMFEELWICIPESWR